MSAVSSVTSFFPLRSLATETCGTSGREYVSMKYCPEAGRPISWSASSGVSSVSPVPSILIL